MINLTSLLGLKRIDLNRAIEEAVPRHDVAIADLIRGQLDEGKDGDDKSLGRYSTVKYKGYLTPVNLKRTGDWRAAIRVDPDYTQLQITDQEYKTGFLVKRYNERILKLSKQSENRAAKILEGTVATNIKQQLGI